MKKLFYSAAIMALAFFAGSCQQENLEPVGGNTVTYTVQVPDALATKALGDDITNINVLHYEVYRTEVANTVTFTAADNLLYHKTATMTNGVATINLELVNDQNYTVLFWAQVGETNEAYDVTDLTNVTVKSPLKANQESYAAFSGVDFIVEGKDLAGRKVTLKRPISQINIATTPGSLDGNGAFLDDVVLEGSSVTVAGLSNSFNVATQEPGAEMTTTYEFAEQAVPAHTLEVNNENYPYVAMNYVGFADAMGSQVKVSYVINTSEGDIDNDIENVPVKPNYRTNIVGNLITATSDYTVTLDDKWEGVAKEYEIWDGETLMVPTTNDAGEYIVSQPSEWAYLANLQNPATKADPVPVVINLTSNLDFGGNELTGLVAASNNSLTVKGNGYTIMNAKMVSGNNDNGTPCAALFVSLSSSELTVSDLNVKNVNVVVDQDPEWGYAAVLVAYAEGKVTLNNIKVSNSTVYGTHSIGTAVGFIAAYSSVEINNFTADGIKLSNADVEGESGAMGGFTGRVAGKLTAENVKVSNSTIEAYVGTDQYQKRSISKFIGNFVNGAVINVTGAVLDNVTIDAKNELAETQQCLYTEYLGGWRDENDKNEGSVSINGIEITKDQTNEDITIDTPAELATAISNAADGAVIPVSGEIPTTSLDASGKSITIVGMSEDAVVDAGNQADATTIQGNITFKNLTFKFTSAKDHYDCGFDADNGTLTFENCKFEGVTTTDGQFVFNNCQFTNTNKGKYAAWVYNGKTVYNNCTFIGVDRAAKVFNENPYSNLTATYNNCTFKSSTPNKTAVEVNVEINTVVPTYVEINNPTIENMGVAEHYAVGADGICNLETSGVGLGIVNLNGKGYSVASTAAQLQILANAGKDVTIEFANDIEGDLTIVQKADADVVLFGNDKNYKGVITVNGDGRSTGKETLTFNDINFTTDAKGESTFINAPSKINNKYNYSHNVTIENCDFTSQYLVTDESSADFTEIGSASFTGTYNLVMRNCTATKMHSLIQVQSCDNTALIENVTASACKNGIAVGNTAYPTIKNATIDALAYGVRADGDAARGSLVVESSSIAAPQPIIVRKLTTKTYNVALKDVTLETEEAWDVVFTNGSDDAAYATPTGAYTITGADNYKVYPRDNQ